MVRDFPVSIKLNASDFQKGAFTNAECVALTGMLNHATLDLLELSGGSLEQPQAGRCGDQGRRRRRPRLKARAGERLTSSSSLGAVKAAARMPVMVTGGFRTVAGMIEAVEAGDTDLIGLGRPLIADPDTPTKILSGEIDKTLTPEANINLFHLLAWNNMQLERLADGLEPDLAMTGEAAAAQFKDLEQANFSTLLRSRGVAVAA
ncbi:MAG: hypothetical protein WDM85_00555 [Caulobacteraceae bacterium]